MQEKELRLFFGAETVAPWPTELPSGRILKETSRHITLAFLGNVVCPALDDIPLPSFRIGPVGKTDEVLFLPQKHNPRVVAWHVSWLTPNALLETFQKELVTWLDIDTQKKFLSHITLARAPFEKRAWEEAFIELPVIIPAIHLYESVGNLTYVPRWSFHFASPFTEIPHTADIAFCVQGKDLQELYLHAQIALAFKYPPVLTCLKSHPVSSLDEIIMGLNELIADLDATLGSPFKAVSFHGTLKEVNNLMQWEMVVDV